MICQSCLFLKKEKTLTFIVFRTIKKEPSIFYSRARKSVFCAVVYGLMYHEIEDATPISKIVIEDVEKVLGKDLYFQLQKIEPYVMLDYTVFGFFDRCRNMNKLLVEFGFFKKFYEQRNKFRYQLQQKLKSKNEMKTELSACVIQKFNGYDLLRNTLQRSPKIDLVPIDIVYEPSLDVSKPISCFFCTPNSYSIPDILWKISWKQQKKMC